MNFGVSKRNVGSDLAVFKINFSSSSSRLGPSEEVTKLLVKIRTIMNLIMMKMGMKFLIHFFPSMKVLETF